MKIKAKQEELNVKQHQMALLNQDLLQLNSKLPGGSTINRR